MKKSDSFKLKYGIIAILIITIIGMLLVNTFYIGKEIDKNKQLQIEQKEKKERESIDYSDDVYFKEVEDEVAEEDLQDFSNYKDVPELIVENDSNRPQNTSNEIINNDDITDPSEINTDDLIQIVPLDTISTERTLVENSGTAASTEGQESIITKNEISNSTTSTAINTIEEKEPSTQPSKPVIDYIKVIGVEKTKDGEYIIPKKARRKNTFKIRMRLKKPNNLTSNNSEVRLVIKNPAGTTIKIDNKKIAFKNNKVLYLTFYETFKEQLEVGKNYNFYIYVDDELVRNLTKAI